MVEFQAAVFDGGVRREQPEGAGKRDQLAAQFAADAENSSREKYLQKRFACFGAVPPRQTHGVRRPCQFNEMDPTPPFGETARLTTV